MEEFKRMRLSDGKKSFAVENIDNSQRILVDKMAIFDSVKASDINKENEITVTNIIKIILIFEINK